MIALAIFLPWIYVFVRQRRAHQDTTPAVAYLVTTGAWLVAAIAVYQQMPSALTGRVACDELARNAIRVSEESNRGTGAPTLVSVMDLAVETDNQGKPPSGPRRTLLVCTGTGYFDDTQEIPLRLELWANSNGEPFVEYSAR